MTPINTTENKSMRGCVNVVNHKPCAHKGGETKFTFADSNGTKWKVYLCSFHRNKLDSILETYDPEFEFSVAHAVTEAEFIDQTKVMTLDQWDERNTKAMEKVIEAVNRADEQGTQTKMALTDATTRMYTLVCNSCGAKAKGDRTKLDALRDRGGQCKRCAAQGNDPQPEPKPTTHRPQNQGNQGDERIVKPTCSFWQGPGKGKCGTKVPMAHSQAQALAAAKTPVLCEEHQG